MKIYKLSPNPAKTEYMIIGHARKVNTLNKSNALMLNDSVIKRVTKTKSLGVTARGGGGYMTCGRTGVCRPVFRKAPSSNYRKLPSYPLF